MDRDDAETILDRIRRDEAQLWRSREFLARLEERGYTIRDAYNILQHGKVEAGPVEDKDHGNHVVRLEGKSLDGRRTRLAIGLREVGPSILITIIDLTASRRRGRKKR